MVRRSPSSPFVAPLRPFRFLIVASSLLHLLLTAGARAEAPPDHPGTARFEMRFLTGMIDHHHMAVMMSDLCDGRVLHDELAEFCRHVAAVQTNEIEEMQAWLAEWYGMAHEPSMQHRDNMLQEDLADLSGEEFEIAYMEMMIHHHEEALRDAERCLERADHEELLDLCRIISEFQAAEVNQLHLWLCSWYEQCDQ